MLWCGAIEMANPEVSGVQLFAITYVDGSLGVGIAKSDGINSGLEAVQNMMERVVKTSGRSIVRWRKVSSEEIPSDRRYRDAWVDTGDRIVPELERSKGIFRDHLRRLRVPLLEELDVAYQRADEMGDTIEKLRVANVKQRLRDITGDPRIEAAKTIEELDALDIVTSMREVTL